MRYFGIVGAGIIGEQHKDALIKNDSCVIQAVCDINTDKAQKLAEGTSARVYTDYKEMQKNENLDAVILNLPHFLHMEVSIFFLEHGVAVLCEKPMANTVAECDKMIEASQRTGTPLAIGHVQRYFSCYPYIKKIIETKELGELCSFTETRNIDYFTNRAEWFLSKKQAGGGILMNYGAHSIDKLLYVTGQKVTDVAAFGSNFLNERDIESSAQVLLKFSGGATASLTYCGCKVPDKLEMDFYFTNGAIHLNGGSRVFVSGAGGTYEEIKLSGVSNFLSPQLDEFLKLLDGKDSEIVTPQYGREVISVLEKAFKGIL